MPTIKYVIADDHKIFRQGLAYALSDDPGLKMAGEVENGIELMKLLEQQQPDVVLLDFKMPGMDGIEATQKMHANYPQVKILILTGHDDEHLVVHLLESGAHGYLLKNSEPEEIKKAIHWVYENDHYFNHQVSNILLKTLTGKSAAKPKEPVKLTDRETEVLKMICEELTTTEIAAKLFLSPRTVDGIRTTMIEKTGVRNTAGLVLFAVKTGLCAG